MHPVFQEAVHFPTEHRCLAMRLEPLVLGHLAILNDARSPFVTFQESISRADLIFAVAVCAQPYRKALAMQRKTGLLERLYMEWVTWRWGRAIHHLDLNVELGKFWEYLAFHRRFPDIRPAKGATRTLNSPTEWRLATMLIEDFGMSWEEAWNTPVLRSHALWAVHGDREGWLDMESNDPLYEARCDELARWAREEDKKFSDN